MSDFYNVLGVNKNSTQDEIKKAYRKKAVEHHPDKGGDESVFKKINEAYDTLGDSGKRQQYDSPRSNPFGGYHSQNMNQGGPFGPGPDFMNMFFKHTQQPHPFMQRSTKQDNKPTELRQTIQVDMKDVYHGCKKNMKIKTSKKCSFCSETCKVCKGTGFIEKSITKTIHHARFVQITKMECDKCNGSGETSGKTNCEKCNKTGLIEKNTAFNIEIPPKSFQDFVMRIKHPEENDVFIVIKVIIKCPEGFYKNGDNLCYTHRVSLIDTILGTAIKIKHPSGENIEIDYRQRPDIIRPDTTLYIDNKGVTPGSDLMVKFDIVYPKMRVACSDENKDTFDSLRENFEKILH